MAREGCPFASDMYTKPGRDSSQGLLLPEALSLLEHKSRQMATTDERDWLAWSKDSGSAKEISRVLLWTGLSTY